MQLLQYRRGAVAQAAVIVAVQRADTGGNIGPANLDCVRIIDAFGQFWVIAEAGIFAAGVPVEGDYWVRHEDGSGECVRLEQFFREWTLVRGPALR